MLEFLEFGWVRMGVESYLFCFLFFFYYCLGVFSEVLVGSGIFRVIVIFIIVSFFWDGFGG